MMHIYDQSIDDLIYDQSIDQLSRGWVTDVQISETQTAAENQRDLISLKCQNLEKIIQHQVRVVERQKQFTTKRICKRKLKVSQKYSRQLWSCRSKNYKMLQKIFDINQLYQAKVTELQTQTQNVDNTLNLKDKLIELKQEIFHSERNHQIIREQVVQLQQIIQNQNIDIQDLQVQIQQLIMQNNNHTINIEIIQELLPIISVEIYEMRDNIRLQYEEPQQLLVIINEIENNPEATPEEQLSHIIEIFEMLVQFKQKFRQRFSLLQDKITIEQQIIQNNINIEGNQKQIQNLQLIQEKRQRRLNSLLDEELSSAYNVDDKGIQIKQIWNIPLLMNQIKSLGLQICDDIQIKVVQIQQYLEQSNYRYNYAKKKNHLNYEHSDILTVPLLQEDRDEQNYLIEYQQPHGNQILQLLSHILEQIQQHNFNLYEQAEWNQIQRNLENQQQ